ncbi:hypothetical protein MRB53_036873 [Persea americana]|nr:hypothetical protein MRB53_036873 [Persea americana]
MTRTRWSILLDSDSVHDHAILLYSLEWMLLSSMAFARGREDRCYWIKAVVWPERFLLCTPKSQPFPRPRRNKHFQPDRVDGPRHIPGHNWPLHLVRIILPINAYLKLQTIFNHDDRLDVPSIVLLSVCVLVKIADVSNCACGRGE